MLHCYGGWESTWGTDGELNHVFVHEVGGRGGGKGGLAKGGWVTDGAEGRVRFARVVC